MSSSRRISLRHLRYFVAVAECGKVSDAAKLVSISQSAITTALQELEDIVGVALIERGPRGATLTFKGYQLLQRAHHILNDVEDAVRALGDGQEAVAGRIRLVVTDVIAAYFMPALVTRFKRVWPRVDIEVLEASRNHLEEALESTEADLGLVILTNSEPRRTLAAETLARLSRHAWVSQNHPLLALPEVTAADLAKEPYVMLMRDQVEVVTLTRFAAMELQPRVAYRVSSVEAVRSLVANGAGVTVLSDLLYRPWSLEGRRVEKIEVPVLFPGVMEIGLVWLADRPFAPAAAALRDFLRGTSALREDVRLAV